MTTSDGEPESESGPDPTRSGEGSVGPLAVEAALLLDVVADRLTSMRPADAGAGPSSGQPSGQPSEPPADQAPGPEPAPPPAATRSEPRLGPDGRCPECGSIPGASSCTACPLCRFLAVLRGERPEATAKLVDGALLIVRTLRSLLPDAEPAGAAAGQAGGSGEQRAGSQPASSARRPGGLEHIDIR